MSHLIDVESITSSWHENVREDERGHDRVTTFREYSSDPWPLKIGTVKDGPWQVKEIYQQHR